MTLAETLSKGVDNFFDCSIPIRITFILIPIAIIFQTCGIGTGTWSGSDQSRQGLWKYCYDSGDFSCCEDIADKLVNVPGWLISTRVFQCLACVTAVITFVTIILYSCVSETLKNVKLIIVTIVTCLLTAFFLMISVSIYGDNYRKSNWLQGHYLSGSFAVVLIAFFLYAVSAVILLVMECQNRQFAVAPSSVQTTSARVEPSAPPLPNQSQAPTSHVQSNAAPSQRGRPAPNENPNECVICLDRPKEVIFLDCGHIACCESCSNTVINGNRTCPICRQNIRDHRRVFNA